MYYKPGRHFMKQLKILDPRLGCEFNRDTQRFNVTYQRVVGLPVVLFPCISESGGFRFPDKRDLDKLGQSDCARVSMRDRLNQVSFYMNDYREKREKAVKDDIRHATLDGKRQLLKAVNQLHRPGKDATFRRVEPKPKGKVFKQD